MSWFSGEPCQCAPWMYVFGVAALFTAVALRKYADQALCHIITHYRPMFALFVLMPLSALTEAIFYARNRIEVWLLFNRASGTHATRVAAVQRQLRAWNDEGRTQKLCTARPGWMAMSLRVGKYKRTHRGIDVSALRNVLSIDEERRIVHVEPNVNMGQLTATLNPMGWTVPVVPELDALTVGGLVNGVGVEATSHVHGLFLHTCVAYEVALPSGEVVRCSADENPRLFRAIPWSHGTLGFLVGAEIKIVPVKPFVKLTYTPCYDKDTAVAFFQECSHDEANDFVEGLAYSQDEYVIMTGVYHDGPGADDEDASAPTPVNRIGRYWKPWFYKHVQAKLNAGDGAHAELIPLRDYYHRHTRSIFWELEDIVPFGNHPLFRWTLGWLMPPHIALLKRTQTEELRKLYEQHHVVQDMLVPVSELGASLDAFHEEFEVYPLWLCPMRIFESDKGFIGPSPAGEEMFVDVGAYGTPKSAKFTARESCRTVERFVASVDGFQMLYADCYMTRPEFREMFDHAEYDALREELGCTDCFPEVYDKVSKAARH